ncbi:tRNA (adenosine(37)-N6)-threonylcarbamoyltransferase complex dimerization subunit type 1 TsaB [Prochlorothrix hollandica]|uniref:tRNA (adenosine(37)-N6)-threonylcarbamoyltransferase complex dimerization subunit type 1 TsaB n=1 Tax=Prochlorothrix hollandica TaxID=1223 RepID=UPI00333EDB3C
MVPDSVAVGSAVGSAAGDAPGIPTLALQVTNPNPNPNPNPTPAPVIPAYGLALHTTTPHLGLALGDGAGYGRHQTWNLGRDLASQLQHHLGEFLQPQTWQDLAFIAVAQGPGGFTGTRLGMVTARTLAQFLDIPLFAVSTLAALAWQAGPGDGSAIAVCFPARRDQVFGGIYQKMGDDRPPLALVPDSVLTADQWQTQLQTQLRDQDIPLRLLARLPSQDGSSSPDPLGFQAAGAIVANPPEAEAVTAVLAIAQAAWLQGDRPHWSTALPFYGQSPVITPPSTHP